MRKTLVAGFGVAALCGLVASTSVFQPEADRPVRPGQGQPTDPAQFMARLMEFDSNGDGKLSREELADSPMGRGFDRFDTNGDGFIDKTELEALAANRGGRPGAGGGAPGAGGAPAADVPFEANMSNAGRALRRIQRSEFTADTREGDLGAVQQIQVSLVAAKAQILGVPMSKNAQAKFGTDEAKYQAEFRTSLIKAIKEALDLEMALVQGNAAAATAARMRLVEVQSQGHDLFEEPREGAPAGGGRQGAGRPGGGGN